MRERITEAIAIFRSGLFGSGLRNCYHGLRGIFRVLAFGDYYGTFSKKEREQRKRYVENLRITRPDLFD